MRKSNSRGRCYKHFLRKFRIPQNNVHRQNICSEAWTYTKIQSVVILLQRYTINLFIAFEMAYFCCFAFWVNLDFLELLLNVL